MTISVGEEKPFVPRFFDSYTPPGRRKIFPADQRELCLATAWRLVEDGQSVLIYCPERRSVMPFAKTIVDLHRQGGLSSVLVVDEQLIASALVIGTEWLGENHVLLQCLKLGIAIHHGALPSPYRKEVERLLQAGILKVTVSSPTLAQGLNLSATSLIFSGLYRNRKIINISEFRNVIGRAGRAYVDIEGLVLLPIFTNVAMYRRKWKELIDDQGGREMESGLVLLVYALLTIMAKRLNGTAIDQMIEYITGTHEWNLPSSDGQSSQQANDEQNDWHQHLTNLDTAIMSLLGEQVVSDSDLARSLELALQSSLFTRRLQRIDEEAMRDLITDTLFARAKFIWANSTAIQRRGYFLAGVGLETGKALDAHAERLESLLVSVNSTLLMQSWDDANVALVSFAEIIFTIPPFIPQGLPENWRDVLSVWLSGAPIGSLASGVADDVLKFVEDGLIYRLSWGMEAVRVRGLAHAASSIEESPNLADFELGLAVAAVETGTTNRSAAYLIQSGFGSRLAAIKAVNEGAGTFTKASELKQWLKNDSIVRLTSDVAWPTSETHSLWLEFINKFENTAASVWKHTSGTVAVTWLDGKEVLPGTPIRFGTVMGTENLVYSANYDLLGELNGEVNFEKSGLLIAATVSEIPNTIFWEHIGPDL